MSPHQKVYSLEGVAQHYAWGGYEFIPELMGLKNTGREPYAEFWMGMHHRGPASLQTPEGKVALEKFIRQRPAAVLGPTSLRQFGPRLSFLFKILDVRQMLSIQAHPSKERAEAGFRRENEIGIPLDAPNRTYKDDNHKPEVMVALTDFWLLHGFLPPEKMARQLSLVPELEEVSRFFETNKRSIQRLYQWIMEMPQERVDQILLPLRNRLTGPYERGELPRESPAFWAARAFRQFHPKEGDCDRGILSIFIMNIVRVAPGQAIYQDAGILHAYLEGINVELMANSDNVFRGGLTFKHVNVPELMRNLSFAPVTPNIIKGNEVNETLTVFATPAPDFELSRIRLSPGKNTAVIEAQSPEILIVLEGAVTVNGRLQRSRGTCFFVPATTKYTLHSENGAVIFRARTPVQSPPEIQKSS